MVLSGSVWLRKPIRLGLLLSEFWGPFQGLLVFSKNEFSQFVISNTIVVFFATNFHRLYHVKIRMRPLHCQQLSHLRPYILQAIEVMGHQVKVVAKQSEWDPKTFLGKVFALEMRVASEHDVLGIRSSLREFVHGDHLACYKCVGGR